MELKLGSIPVRVHAWFFIMAAMLGSSDRDPARLGAWVLVVLVSVLVHELGHALMGIAFGLVPRIDLHMSGGTTSFNVGEGQPSRPRLGAAKNIAISLAGPLAGFVFAGAVFFAGLVGLTPSHPLAIHVLGLVLWVNVAWGIFNLLPMLPLDGGNVMNAALVAASKKYGEKIARVVSIAVAAAIAAYALSNRSWWILYLVASFTALNVQALRGARVVAADRGLVEALEKGHLAFENGDARGAIALLEPHLATRASPELRQAALRIYVLSLIRVGMTSESLAAIDREGSLVTADDRARFAAALRESGRDDEAALVARGA